MKPHLLSIEDDVKEEIYRIRFNEEGYKDYLARRQVAETHISTLSILITSSGVSPGAHANFTPPSRREPHSTIRISPFLLPRDPEGQSLILLHETEHFIHSTHPAFRPYYRARLAAFGLTALAGGGYMGLSTYHAITHALHQPHLVEISAGSVGSGVAGVVGALGGLCLAKGIDTFNPEEILAQRGAKNQLANLQEPLIEITLPR
jgi:hypothetical protein